MKLAPVLALSLLLPGLSAQDDRGQSVEMFWTMDNRAALTGNLPVPRLGLVWGAGFMTSKLLTGGFTILFVGYAPGVNRLTWMDTEAWIFVEPAAVVFVMVAPLTRYTNFSSSGFLFTLPYDNRLIGADLFLQALALDHLGRKGDASGLLWGNIGLSSPKGKAALNQPLTFTLPHRLWNGASALFRNSRTSIRSVVIEGTAEGPTGARIELRTGQVGQGLVLATVKPGKFRIALSMPPASSTQFPGFVFPNVLGMTKITFKIIVEK